MRGKLLIVGLVSILFIFFVNKEIHAEEFKVTDEEELKTALDLAKTDDVILLGEGTYNGNFVIENTVTLIGEDGATIQGLDHGSVLTIHADDVVIENLQITGGGTQNAGIYVKSNRNRITNNRFYDVFHGVMVKDGYGNEITNNMMTSLFDAKHKGFGVYLIEAPYSIVTENIIYDSNDGIYISFSDLCEITGNTIKKARYGVHTMDSENVIIAQNVISNSRNGLMIMQSYSIRIKENYLHSNTTVDGAGMFIFDTFDSTISANIMEMNNKGIYLENALRNEILFNSFEGNDIGIEIGVDSNDNQINLNNFIGNTQQVISDKSNENSFTSNGYGNYWDNQSHLNINQDELNDYAYKSGDVFYNLTSDEPYLQLFTGSPAVRLWNTVEQYVPIPSNQFIVDEKPLIQPASIEVDIVGKQENKQQSIIWESFFFYVGLLCISVLIIGKTRRKQDA
ncbi:NosD domain-containing protein [Ornithinibacillus halophilus]|uniref:Nitrous oxide reductase family maturation protein NosD n=1 Tax=Ornithinibacillus halophilus TaxID=930117 RepID=A0A1M5FAU8_9BACI|nr:NosD domain-containing protein [Ornithinibacillus halophilus]SHF88740.1 nitrous oxide reductase family maturation protein NosD [Ornithinibacillus halophilus]